MMAHSMAEHLAVCSVDSKVGMMAVLTAVLRAAPLVAKKARQRVACSAVLMAEQSADRSVAHSVAESAALWADSSVAYLAEPWVAPRAETKARC